MKELKFKNFRCVEQKNGEYRVYFTLNGEERWIGYYNGSLSGDEEQDEKRLVGAVRDYSDVIMKWEIANTRTIYKINIYEAYRMDEKGIRFMPVVPNDTASYKHEVLGVKEVRFPAWKDGERVTEDDNTFSFVSSEGIRTYKFSEPNE